MPAYVWLLVGGTAALIAALIVFDGPRLLGVLAGSGLMVILLAWNRQSVLFLALAIFVSAVVLVPTTNLAGNDILRLLVPSVCATSAVLALLRRGSTIRLPSGTLRAFLGFFLALFVASSFYRDPGGMEALRTYAFLAALAAVLAENLTARERLYFFRFITVLAAIQALVSWIEYGFLVEPLWGAPISPLTGLPTSPPNELFGIGHSRAQGTLGHPLIASLFMVVGLAVNVAEKELWPRSVRWLLSLVIISAALPNGSRSGLLIMVGVVLLLTGTVRTAAKVARFVCVAAIAPLLATELGLFKSDLLQTFVGSGSVTHRAGAFQALPRLLGQDPLPLLFGNGFLSRDRMFRSGLLQLDGFAAVDNQLVLTLSEAGLIGALILIGVFFSSIKMGADGGRAAMLALIPMMFVFDVLSWASTLVLFATLIGLCSLKRTVTQAGVQSGAESPVAASSSP